MTFTRLTFTFRTYSVALHLSLSCPITYIFCCKHYAIHWFHGGMVSESELFQQTCPRRRQRTRVTTLQGRLSTRSHLRQRYIVIVHLSHSNDLPVTAHSTDDSGETTSWGGVERRANLPHTRFKPKPKICIFPKLSHYLHVVVFRGDHHANFSENIASPLNGFC
jgi:hypothetical protein